MRKPLNFQEQPSRRQTLKAKLSAVKDPKTTLQRSLTEKQSAQAEAPKSSSSWTQWTAQQPQAKAEKTLYPHWLVHQQDAFKFYLTMATTSKSPPTTIPWAN